MVASKEIGTLLELDTKVFRFLFVLTEKREDAKMNNVQVGGMRMNKAVTSKEEILKASREIVSSQGLSAVNMRLVASRCNIALGSVYNYFPSKSELMLATIESVWMDIFHMNGAVEEFESFPQCLQWLFTSIRQSSDRYPEFFNVHSMIFASGDRSRGRKLMEQSLVHLKEKLLDNLNRDPRVHKECFQGALTKETFIDYVFTLLLSLLLEKKETCEPLLVLVEQSIYRSLEK